MSGVMGVEGVKVLDGGRQFGQMTMIYRDRQSKTLAKKIPCAREILSIIEPGKVEMAAGLFSVFHQPAELGSFSIPAGGRDKEPDGKYEKLKPNMIRELLEELEELKARKIGKISDIDITHQTSAPFIVAQVDKRNQRFNELAATNAAVPFDTLPPEIQRNLENVVRRRRGKWLSLTDLVAMFAIGKDIAEPKLEGRTFRPQFLTASMLYYLEAIAKYEPTDVSTMVDSWNANATRFLLKTAAQIDYSINNGTFSKTGKILTTLSPEDQTYLNLRNSYAQ